MFLYYLQTRLALGYKAEKDQEAALSVRIILFVGPAGIPIAIDGLSGANSNHNHIQSLPTQIEVSQQSKIMSEELCELEGNNDTILVKDSPNTPNRNRFGFGKGNNAQPSFVPHPKRSTPSKMKTQPAPAKYQNTPRIKNRRVEMGNNGENGNGGPKGNGNEDKQSKISRNNLSSKQKKNYHVGSSKKAKKKDKNSRQVSQEVIDKSYEKFHKEMKKRGLDSSKITKERYEEMCRDRKTQQFESQNLEEANGLFEAEVRGYLRDVEPLYDPNNMLDSQATLPDGRKVFVDHKTVPDFGKMQRDKGIDISNFPKSDAVAFNIGKDSAIQKSKHIPVDKLTGETFHHPNFPMDSSEVIHLINLNDIVDKSEVPGLVQAVLDGAEQQGNDQGFIFIGM